MDTAAHARPSSHSSQPYRPAPGPRLYGAMAAVAALAALAGWFGLYPLDRLLAGALLGAYGLLVLALPGSWLILMPALWPVVDLAPWSGHIHFTESDALALTTLAALGLRETFAPPAPTLAGRAPVKLTVAALGLFALLAASVMISGLRGLYPLPPLDASALVSYSTTVNALRVGKGFVLAFALIPFLHLAVRRDGETALNRFGLGLTLGLTSCALAALWERLAFTGFTNFAADYRSTALFWEMHVGGAALDAWLTLSFPFALLCLVKARSPLGKGLALVAVGLGSYALFTTFSRIVYVALVVSVTLLGGMALLRPTAGAAAGHPRRRPGVLLLLVAGVLLGCALTFREGGYRGLLAFAGLVLLAYPAGGVLAGMRGGKLLGGLLAGLALSAVSLLATLWLPKGAYLIYALSWAACAGVLLARRGAGTAPAGTLVPALLSWTALNAILVSAYWSDQSRFLGSTLAAALVLGALARQAVGRTPLWSPRVQDLYGVGAMLVLGGMLTTTLGGYYMGARLSTTGEDLGGRLQHIQRSLSLMRTSADSLLGIGLGRYPDAYFWAITDPGTPGSLSLLHDDKGRFMRLGGARRAHGGDEILLLSQRIPTDTATRVRYRFKARSESDVQLRVSICRKHLLYEDGCVQATASVKGGSGWQDVEGIWPEPVPAAGHPPRMAVFSIGLATPTQVDLDDFELIDAHLRPLLRNGDFERGVDFWFFSSDHDHLPWHAKNLVAHTYVEQGLLGLVALGLIFAKAFLHLLRSPTRLQTHAPTLLAALAGVATVGLVDSVLDIPRITLFLTLLLWLALTLRQPPAR